MIRLFKRPISPELAERIRERTERFLKLLAEDSEVPDSLATAYRDPVVKQLLREETADKCAYCESKVPHVDYGHVEHIVPKAEQPGLRFTYENLTYACAVCNTKKGDYFDIDAPLLNPYADDPAEHLLATGPMVLRLPSSDRGMVTERQLELNRSALIERRKERLESVATLVDQYCRTRSAGIKAVLESAILEESRDDKEYSFVVRAYLETVLPLCA